MRPHRSVPEGIRITRIGLWYVGLTLLVAVPAANTGNNALYLVEACLLGLLVVSGVTSRQNLRGLDLELLQPQEIFVGQPASLRLNIRNRSRLLARFLLVIAGVGEGKPVLVTALGRSSEATARLELVPRRRGVLRIPYLRVTSIFPLGLFRKGLRYYVGAEVLVYPEILSGREPRPEAMGGPGFNPSRRVGAGHDLLSLRGFRAGDDRRGIHWKRSARTGELVYMEREEEKERRLAIVFDNAVGRPRDASEERIFERLVSEAATAAHVHLGRGHEVQLTTREEIIPFGRGVAQRRRILEALALIEPLPRRRDPLLTAGRGATALHLGAAEVGG